MRGRVGVALLVITALFAALLFGPPSARAQSPSRPDAARRRVAVPAIVSPRTSHRAHDPGNVGATPRVRSGEVVKVDAAPVQRKVVGFVDGESREDPSRRNASMKVFDNPDGTTTAKVYSEPVHVADGRGGWKDIDLSLRRNGTRLAPSAAPTNMDVASRANNASLATLRVGKGQSVGFGLEGAAAVDASVTDNTVTYPSVLPDVSLRFETGMRGLKEELVLASPSAPARFRFPLQVTGVTPRQGTTSPIEFVDQAGRTAAYVPNGFMFDSSAGADVLQNERHDGVTYTLTGDAQHGWAIVVDLDRAWLDDPARQYPVTVDPATWLSTDFPDDTFVATNYTANESANFDLSVGNVDNVPVGLGGHFARAYMHFDVNALNGKQIIAAKFSLFQRGGLPWCASRGMGAWRVTQAWGGSTMTGWPGANFDGEGAFGLANDDTKKVAWANVDCATNVYKDFFSYGDNSMLKLVRGWTDGTYPQLGLMFQPDNTSLDQGEGYRDFASWDGGYPHGGDFGIPVIDITYNDPPSTPTRVSPANGGSVHDVTPQLRVSASDPNGDALTYQYQVSTSSSMSSPIVSASGQPATFTVPAGSLAFNQTYYWRSRANDGNAWSGWSPVWSFQTVNAAPPVPALSSPAADAVLTAPELTFAAGAVTDADGDSVKYQFQIASGSDGQTGRLATSAWRSSPSWTPPAGTFADGGTYSWTVRSQDTADASTGTSPWATARAVKVDFRLGKRSTLPYDEIGPVSVNLASGNLFVSVEGPTFPTVGDPVRANFNYNSQTPEITGLTGDYYQDLDADGVLDAGEPRLLHRVDAQLNFNWNTSSPSPGVIAPRRWLGRWHGGIQVPAGTDGNYIITSAKSDDTVKVKVSGATVLTTTVANATVDSTPVALSSTGPTPIEVEYTQAAGRARLRLQIRSASDPASAAFDIPADWFSPDIPSLPDGWSRAGDVVMSAAYTSLRPVNERTTTLVDYAGTDHVYTSSALGWTPPAGEDGVLTHVEDGSWSLAAEDGYVYRFDASGQLLDVSSALDDTTPGRLTYTFTEPNADGITRLTSIQEPTGRRADLRYGPSASCPTASGFDATAPTDMLCQVTYTDFGGGATKLYYSNGHVARIENPGQERYDFGYDGQGRMTKVRDPLTNDLIAAGVITDGTSDTHNTIATYTGQRVTDVKAPVANASMTDAQRPRHWYLYTWFGADIVLVHVAGAPEPQGYSKELALDDFGHVFREWDAAGIQTDRTWDLFKDRPTKVVDRHNVADATNGLVTTWTYDAADRLTDVYGPGAPSEFDANGASTTAPHVVTTYDQNLNGLQAKWYGNAQLGGVPVAHTTTAPNVDWASGSPNGAVPVDNFSGSLSGEVTLPSAGWLTLDADGGRVVVDDQTVIDTWGDAYPDMVKSDGPVGYWRLGETSGTSAKDEQGIATGTYSGTHSSVTGTSGDTNTAQSFSGGGHVDLPDGFADFSDGMTIEGWVKPTDTNSNATILELGSGQSSNEIFLARNGTTAGLQFKVVNGSTTVADVTAPNALTLNVWQHVAVTMDSAGVVIIWRNGTPVGLGNGQLPIVVGRTASAIGARGYSSPAGDWHGALDEVAVFPSALSSGRIAARTGVVTGTTPPVGSKQLTAGTHRIRVDYQERTGTAHLTLSSTVSGTQYRPRYGLPTSSTDADGKVTAKEYANPEVGLPTATAQDPAGLNLRTVTAYEPAGAGKFFRRTSRTLPAGNSVTYSYWGAGSNPATASNPCVAGSPAVSQGGQLRYASGPGPSHTAEQVYDANGRVVATRMNSEAWTCTTYDARDRITQVTVPASSSDPARTVTNNYAVGGNPAVTSVADAAGTVTTTVDWIGRVVAYEDSWGNDTTTTYDQIGRTVDVQGPAGLMHTTYDPAGRVASLSLDGLTIATIGYDAPSGLPTSVSYPSGAGNAGNGTSLSIGYDARGRKNSLSWSRPNGTSLASDSVTYSAAGRVVDETLNGTDASAGGLNYLYDAAGRLFSAVTSGHWYVYSYGTPSGCGAGTLANPGANNDRTGVNDVGVASTSSCYNSADQLVSSTDARYGSFSYDAHGGTLQAGPESMTWDGANRHTGTTDSGTTVTYTRDATDRIVARQVSGTGGVTRRYGFSGEGDTPDVVMNTSNAVLEKLVQLPGGVTLTIRSGSKVWSYPNMHGDVMATADAAGAPTGAYAYDPYGHLLSSAPDNGSDAYDFGWLGQQERGLEHFANVETIEMGSRPYLPRIGRFLSVDPVEGGSANDYDYVNGDPLNGFDISGELCAWSCFKEKASSVASAVVHAGGTAASWVKDQTQRHWRTLTVVGAVGVCAFASFGACGLAVAGAWGLRSAGTLYSHGWNRGTAKSIAVDGFISYASLATVGAACECAGSPWYLKSLSASLDLFGTRADTSSHSSNRYAGRTWGHGNIRFY